MCCPVGFRSTYSFTSFLQDIVTSAGPLSLESTEDSFKQLSLNGGGDKVSRDLDRVALFPNAL